MCSVRIPAAGASLWYPDTWLSFAGPPAEDRKSTRLNSSHLVISYAVFCLKKKKHQHHDILSVPGRAPTESAAYYSLLHTVYYSINRLRTSLRTTRCASCHQSLSSRLERPQ